MLERRTRTRYVSPITGVESPDRLTEYFAVDWSEGRALLRAMQPACARFESKYRWVYPRMLAIALADGVFDSNAAGADTRLPGT